MAAVEELITEHFDIWTAAIKRKSNAGRGGGSKTELYGVKKLRELILDLAMRGLLVPQDPKDQPAIEILKEIAIKQQKLEKAKKIKKQKPSADIHEDEKPYDLPKNWIWTRLSTLAEIAPRNHVEDESMVGFVPMPLVSTSHTGEHGQEIRPWIEIKKGYTHFADGDIGLAKITPCFENSKAVVFRGLKNGLGAGTTELHIARPIGNFIEPRYVLLHLKSPRYLIIGETKMTGSAGQKRVPKNYFSETPLPLPPLNEQHRIVAKVDELMALCDQLEQQTEANITAHQTLVETLLNTLTQSANTSLAPTTESDNDLATSFNTFEQAWQRIVEHFDTLFTTEYSIELLKQNILQLAVMGKLVAQDPNDEPASELLKRIAAEKVELVEAKKIKKQKALPEISENEKPFELPKSWEWCRLEDLVEIASGITKGRKLAGRNTISVPYLSVANVQRSFLDLTNIKQTDIPTEERDKYQVVDGDLLITEGGDWDKVGRTAIWRDTGLYIAHQNHVFRARPLLPEQNEVWLEKYLNCPFSRDYFAGSSKQTTNLASINKTQLRGCLIAIPPTVEQEKIVAKVDELMTLCDQLKHHVADAHNTQLKLADAVTEQPIS